MNNKTSMAEGSKRNVAQGFLVANAVDHLISFNLFLSRRCFACVKYGIARMDYVRAGKISKQFERSLLYVKFVPYV